MRQGGDGYDVFANNAIDAYDAGALLADALAEYIGAHSPVNPAVEGRITRAESPAALPVTGSEPAGELAASLVLLTGLTLIALGIHARKRQETL